jgi:hypothetical protein
MRAVSRLRRQLNQLVAELENERTACTLFQRQGDGVRVRLSRTRISALEAEAEGIQRRIGQA